MTEQNQKQLGSIFWNIADQLRAADAHTALDQFRGVTKLIQQSKSGSATS